MFMGSIKAAYVGSAGCIVHETVGRRLVDVNKRFRARKETRLACTGVGGLRICGLLMICVIVCGSESKKYGIIGIYDMACSGYGFSCRYTWLHGYSHVASATETSTCGLLALLFVHLIIRPTSPIHWRYCDIDVVSCII